MQHKKLKIVFMGTPKFAVASLNILIENNYDIAAVVTTADKKAGRGRKIQFSDVKQYALENNITLLQPEKLRDQEFIDNLKKINADLFIVVAFRMLPQIVWDMPKYGTFNLHASLLPQYRGAAPINHAIWNNEKETGITTFFLDKKIDTGKIILQEKIEITNKDNAGSLHDKLMLLGSKLVLKTVELISTDNISTIDQQEYIESNLKHAPKIFKDDCIINWDSNALDINNMVRALSPYPGAFTYIYKNKTEKLQLKIFDAEIIDIENEAKCGEIVSNNKDNIYIKCSDLFIKINELQLQGKKRIKTKDFLLGYDINLFSIS